MRNGDRTMEKNVSDACVTGGSIIDTKTGSQICEDEYFEKIQESYDQNLKRFDIVSKDLFKFYFALSDELVKSSYKITNQYLEMEKNLRIYNPTWYYILTSYQFLRNRFLGNTIQSVSLLYSNFTNVWKTSLSIMSESIVSTLENMNRFCSTCNEPMNIKEKPSLSERAENLIKTIRDVNWIYHAYRRKRMESNQIILRTLQEG